MAKRKATKPNNSKSVESAVTAPEHRIEAFAEDLGRMLGRAQNKATSWLDQRASIVKHLEGVRDTATHLLTQLGHTATETVQKVRRRRRGKKYVAPASNPAGGMKPLHRAQKASPRIAPRSPRPARSKGRFPQPRRAPK